MDISKPSLEKLLDLDNEVGLSTDELPSDEIEQDLDIEDNRNTPEEDDIIDDKGPSKKDIDTSFEKDATIDSAANAYKNIISKKVNKIEKAVEDKDDQKYKIEMAALKKYIQKPEVKKGLGTELIRNLVSSVIG